MDPFLEELSRRQQKPADPFAEELSKREYVQPEPPDGMVFNPETGQMVDAKAIAERQSEGVMGTLGDASGVAFKGMPFIGELLDETAGVLGGPVAQEVARQRVDAFEEANPKTSTALQVGAGVSAALPAIAYGAPVVAAKAPTSMAMKMAAGAAAATPLAVAEGGISGFSAGEGYEDRVSEAKRRAAINGMLGVGAGVATPVLAAMGKPVFQKIADALSFRNAAKRAGVSKPARQVLVRALESDDAFAGEGAQRIAQGGPGAMLADAGPASVALLDTAIQKSGKAAPVARRAVESRASDANRQISAALDATFGKPQGVKSTAREISRSTAPARKAAYDQAYSRPIDYASDQGLKIEEVLSRIPPRVKKQAIETANEAMTAQGVKNQQIFASIADDGTVTFRQPPNVQQLDEIKRALGEIAAGDVDQFGRRTASGARAAGLARELRDALGDAVPDYRTAVALGGDKRAQDEALALGRDLLSKRTTREQVAEFAEGLTDAERKAAAQGLRSKIDDELADVKRTLSDPNIDAREATKGIREFSSRANREKVALVIGEKSAAEFFEELDQATLALDLRAGVATNSKTAIRLSTDREIKDAIEPGVVGKLAGGEPLNATRRIAQSLSAQTPQHQLARQDDLYSEIVDALIRRGDAARATLKDLGTVSRNTPINEEAARAIAIRLAPLIASSGYQTGSLSLGRK